LSNSGSWLVTSFAIGTAIALVAGVGFYLFFRIHQELDIQPAYAWRLGGIVFVLGTVIAAIYFRTRGER
jgi:membrane protein implicated in regulation of membrane protease activity